MLSLRKKSISFRQASDSVFLNPDFQVYGCSAANGSYRKMVYPMLQIGSKIRIVSNANVRYEGTFVEIDMDKLQIALCDVHFYGTEARAAEFYIAGQSRIYPFVVFKNTDIKEIVVLENPVPLSPSDANALQVSRTASFASSSGVSSMNASPFHNATPIRRPFERDLSFDEQSFYNSRSSSNNRSFPRASSQYLWRIPRVVDYIGRSGDPKELPLISTAEFATFEQDYDFEKYNKLFVDLCGGLVDLSLTASNNSSVTSFNDSQKAVKTNEEFNWNLDNESPSKSNKTEDSVTEKVEEAVAIVETPPSKGAIPKNIALYQSPKAPAVQSTAYDKSKSFFDTVSCSSIYRSGNINPNWREHNTETFGVPMICHQRRSTRDFRNSSKLPSVAESKQKSPFHNISFGKPANNGRRYNNLHNNNNNGSRYNDDPNVTSQFTIKKVHFKAVFMSKNSTPTKQEQNVQNTQTEANLSTASEEDEK